MSIPSTITPEIRVEILSLLRIGLHSRSQIARLVSRDFGANITKGQVCGVARRGKLTDPSRSPLRGYVSPAEQERRRKNREQAEANYRTRTRANARRQYERKKAQRALEREMVGMEKSRSTPLARRASALSLGGPTNDEPVCLAQPQAARLPPERKVKAGVSFDAPPLEEITAEIERRIGEVPKRVVGPSPFRTCQFIAGEPAAGDSCKCGEPTTAGSPYCMAHALFTGATIPGTGQRVFAAVSQTVTR